MKNGNKPCQLEQVIIPLLALMKFSRLLSGVKSVVLSKLHVTLRSPWMFERKFQGHLWSPYILLTIVSVHVLADRVDGWEITYMNCSYSICSMHNYLISFLEKNCLQASVIFTDGKDVKKISYWCIMYDWVYQCSRFETADRWTVTQFHDHSSVILLESIAMLVNAACDVRWSATDLSSALYRFVVLSYTVLSLYICC